MLWFKFLAFVIVKVPRLQAQAVADILGLGLDSDTFSDLHYAKSWLLKCDVNDYCELKLGIQLPKPGEVSRMPMWQQDRLY